MADADAPEGLSYLITAAKQPAATDVDGVDNIEIKVVRTIEVRAARELGWRHQIFKNATLEASVWLPASRQQHDKLVNKLITESEQERLRPTTRGKSHTSPLYSRLCPFASHSRI